MARALGVLSAVVGVATGMATVIAAIVGHFTEVKNVAVPVIVAIGYLAFAVVVMFLMLAWLLESTPSRSGKLGVMLIGLVVAGAFFAGWWGIVFHTPENAQLIWAGIYLTYGLCAGTWYSIVLAKRAKASRKRCPDCAETVKSAAKVCRYCGFRWHAPIAGSAHQSERVAST